MKRILAISSLLLCAFVLPSQNSLPFTCGTEHLEDIKQEMLKNREEFKNLHIQRGAINYIPVKIFLVAYNDGTGNISVMNALRMMCQLNKAYVDQNIQFYIKELKTLQNTAIAETPRSSGGTLQMSLNKDPKAVNIFITQKILDGVAGYYIGPAASSNDFIVIQSDYIADVRVAPHEMGHYLSLPHTFHGWDADAWDPAKNGNPVGKFAPDGITINEFADSSNCGPKNVGDGFCDTPADYNFGSNTCSYTPLAKDPNGILVHPQTNNFMNYFFGCSEYIFTSNQKDAVLASYNSSGRRDIRGTSPPTVTTITSQATLRTPANGSPTVSADTVTLDWDDVPGATSYLVQYDVVSTFELFVQSIITKESKLKIEKLTQNRTYHWRVIPFNEYSTCFLDPQRFTFKAGSLTAVPDIPEVKSFAVYPNPAFNDDKVHIQLESKTSFNGTINVYDIRGRQLIYQFKDKFQSGLTAKELYMDVLKPGVYAVVLSSGQGQVTRKLVVL